MCATLERSSRPWLFAVGLYSTCVGLVLSLWAASPPANRGIHFLREGSPLDLLSSTFLGGSAVFAALAASDARTIRDRALWLVCSLGSLFLMLDERFQFHEVIGHYKRGDSAFGLDNWNDLTMIFYGVAALGAGLVFLPALFRRRRVLKLLAVGFAFFVVHTLIDAASSAPRDSNAARTNEHHARRWGDPHAWLTAALLLFSVLVLSFSILSAHLCLSPARCSSLE